MQQQQQLDMEQQAMQQQQQAMEQQVMQQQQQTMEQQASNLRVRCRSPAPRLAAACDGATEVRRRCGYQSLQSLQSDSGPGAKRPPPYPMASIMRII